MTYLQLGKYETIDQIERQNISLHNLTWIQQDRDLGLGWRFHVDPVSPKVLMFSAWLLL
jgi:hypothetical protein